MTGGLGSVIVPFRRTMAEVLGEADRRGALSALGIAAFPEPAISDCVARGLTAYRRSSRAYQPGQLAFLCSRDSAVNSLLAEAIAFHGTATAYQRLKAAHLEGTVLLVSFRHRARDIAIRALAQRRHRCGRPPEEETERMRTRRILEAATDLESLPLAICDERRVGSNAIVEAALHYRRGWSFGLMVVDDLQAFDAGWKPRESHVARNTRKIETLRAIAARMAVPATIMVTLASTTEESSRPSHADLVAAGYVAQKGDLVLFVDAPGDTK